MKSISNFWLKSSNNQKILIVIIIVLLIYFARNKYLALTNRPQNVQELKDQLLQNNELQQYNSAGITKSFAESTYVAKAQELYDLMYGVDLWQSSTNAGTNADRVFLLMTFYVKNDVDFLLLHKAFGFRSGAVWSSPSDLKTWLKDDLSQSWIDKINSDYKSKGMLKRI